MVVSINFVTLLLLSSLVYTSDDSISCLNAESNYVDKILLPGYGYSSETQKLSAALCYNVDIETVHSENKLDLSNAMSYSQLLNNLNIHTREEKDYVFFSKTKTSSYLKSIKDTEESLTLNFVVSLSGIFEVKPKGQGILSLNDLGKGVYENDYNNFGLICGDYYITGFTQGARLNMGLTIFFKNHSEKESKEEHIRKSFVFGLFRSASDTQKLIYDNSVGKGIKITAFQVGGEPVHLSKILPIDPSGDFYSLSCDNNHRQDCVTAAHNVIDYIKNDFSKQVSLNPPKGLKLLDVGFQANPISMLGLDIPTSLLTSEVLEARNELTEEQSKYSQYANKVSEAINHYPSSWDKNNKFYSSMEKLAESSKNSLQLLNNSIKTCIDEPGKCINTKNDIMSKVALITPVDLKDLPTIADYKTYGSLSDFLNARGIADLYR